MAEEGSGDTLSCGRFKPALARNSTFATLCAMTFFKAILAWLVIGVVLGGGILMTVHPKSPSWWPLLGAVVCLVAVIGKFGCLPPSDEHHH